MWYISLPSSPKNCLGNPTEDIQTMLAKPVKKDEPQSQMLADPVEDNNKLSRLSCLTDFCVAAGCIFAHAGFLQFDELHGASSFQQCPYENPVSVS